MKCTCNKLDCDKSCLCACHREEHFPELKELNQGLDIIDKAVDLAIERMQKYDLKNLQETRVIRVKKLDKSN